MATAGELVQANIDLQAGIEAPFNTAITTLANYLGSYSFGNAGAEGIFDPQGSYTPPAATESSIKTALDTLVPTNSYPTFNLGALPSYVGLAQNTGATDYKVALFNDTFFGNLKDKLKLVIDNITGSDDVDTLVAKLSTPTGALQTATYQADLQRKQQTLADAYAAADSATGNRGFTYPNSMTIGLKLDAQQKYQFDLAQTSRDIIKQVYDWAQREYQFSISEQSKAAGQDMDFNMKYAEACARTYQLALNGVLETYKEQIAGIVAKFDGEARRYGLCLTAAKSAAEIEQMSDAELAKRHGPHVQYVIEAYRAALESNKINVEKNIAAAKEILGATIAFSSANSNVGVAILNG